MKDIGDRIYELRKMRGLTLEELGNKVGVGKSTVRKWETGFIANMRRDKIALLASALDVSPSYLMGWDDEKETEEKQRKRFELFYSELMPLMEKAMRLDAADRAKLEERAEMLLESNKYQKGE